MKDRILTKTALYGALFFVAAMSAIVYFSLNKSIEIRELSQDGNAISESADAANSEVTQETASAEGLLLFSDEKLHTEYLCIPLPEIQTEDISIENHYMDSLLLIVIRNVDPTFYATNPLSGNYRNIVSAGYEAFDEGVKLSFGMNGMYEYKTVLEDGNLFVSFLNPKEVNDKIVVIDPAAGGQDPGCTDGTLREKDITLAVAVKLRKKLEASGIKAYYTRMDDVNPSEVDRIELAEASKADMYIRIEVDSKEDASIYGVTCLYNDEFFIPGFGNTELADIMETEVVTAVKGKALGLEKSATSDFTLRYATIPATSVKVGCISNRQEAGLLGREDYVEKIADGIYKGILKAYEELV